MDCDHNWEVIREEEATFSNSVCMNCGAYRHVNWLTGKETISPPYSATGLKVLARMSGVIDQIGTLPTILNEWQQIAKPEPYIRELWVYAVGEYELTVHEHTARGLYEWELVKLDQPGQGVIMRGYAGYQAYPRY